MSLFSSFTRLFSNQPTIVAPPTTAVIKENPKDIWNKIAHYIDYRSLSALGRVDRFFYSIVKGITTPLIAKLPSSINRTQVLPLQKLTYLVPIQQTPKTLKPDAYCYNYGHMSRMGSGNSWENLFVDAQNKFIVKTDCVEIYPSSYDIINGNSPPERVLDLPPNVIVCGISRGKAGDLSIWVQENSSGVLFNLLNPTQRCHVPKFFYFKFIHSTKEWRLSGIGDGIYIIDADNRFHGPIFFRKEGKYSTPEVSHDFILAQTFDKKRIDILKTSTEKVLASIDLPDGVKHFEWLLKGKLIGAVAQDTLISGI